jgi:hypothetical protein
LGTDRLPPLSLSAAARRRLLHGALIATPFGAVLPPSRATAQAPSPAQPDSSVAQGAACDGAVVSAIDIRAYPPSYNGGANAAYETMERVVGIRHVTTRREVVRAYLRVRVGKACTERDRSESERLLRAQPFISAASVRVIPDGAGQVRLQVDVIDEIAIVLAGGINRGTLAWASLGSQNISGLGLGVVIDAVRGFAYRDGFGMRAIQYGIFGAPDYLAVTAERKPLGETHVIELAEPFLTDLQRRAFHIGASNWSDYYGVVRPVGDDGALYVRRTSYDAGWVTRIGSPDRRRTIGLLGAVLLGEDVRVGDTTRIVSDTGLVKSPDPKLDGRYQGFKVTRVAGIAGLRSLRFLTVAGFDALRARQDVGIGVQFDVLAGPSIRADRDSADMFVAADLYAGTGDASSFFDARVLAEGRGNRQTHRWDGIVGSARLAWYSQPTDRLTQVVSLEAATVHHLAFPLQLTFRDVDGGIPGFPDATFAGGQRVVARIDERRLIGFFSKRFDFAVAAFADAGKLWAGDVPYGTTTGVEASVGVSLLGGYPAGGKRINRVDFAMPINPQSGRARFELRFSSFDHTRLLWQEPNDVARARTGAVPANLMKW